MARGDGDEPRDDDRHLDAVYDTGQTTRREFAPSGDLVDPEPQGEELDDITADRTRRWATRTILIAALTLLFLNGQSIKTWASTLPPDWATETLRQLAQVWSERMTVAGLDEPRDAIHKGYEGLKGQ